MNANLTLCFLFSPLTVIPTTGHGKELIGIARGRKGEQEAQFELMKKYLKIAYFIVLSQDLYTCYYALNFHIR